MGGRLRICISGGAPLSPHTLEFFFALGITVIEGYGLTETSPVICLNPPGREKPGSVGPPIPGVEVKLGEQDEIITRGPHVMRGYFKGRDGDARGAARRLVPHRRHRTLRRRRLSVHHRPLKDLIVLAGGKKVAPQPIETKLKRARSSARPCCSARRSRTSCASSRRHSIGWKPRRAPPAGRARRTRSSSRAPRRTR
jgi:long-chain acyl-CoA synthetase